MKTTFSCDTPKEMIRAIRAVNALYEGDTKTIMEIGITESPSYSGTLHDALTTLQVRVVNTEWLTKAWVLWMDFGLRYWTQKLIAENDLLPGFRCAAPGVSNMA